MPGSAMAAALAAQEAARRQRRMDAEIERRRASRRAQRMLSRADDAHDHERHPFPCASSCLSCGHLELPRPIGDPMRTDTTAIALQAHKCSHCGGRSFVDFANVSSAAAVRDYERREIELRSGVGLAFAGAFAAIGIGVLAVLGMFATGIDSIMTGSIVLMASGFVMYTMRAAMVGVMTPARRACRWRAPARETTGTVRKRVGERLGQGTATGDRALHAPISGRPVIAWRVEVRYPGDRGEACALLEQECAQISIGGVAIDGEPLVATTATAVRVDSEEARTYLRSRGIDPYDVLEIQERVVEHGAVIVVHADRYRPLAVLLEAAVCR